MFSSGEASTLGRALASIRRRALTRRAAAGALAGAVIAAAPAYLLGVALLAPLLAGTGAILATRRTLATPASYLDAADRDDLVVSATALLGHRARATALAPTVVAAAADRARHTRPPSLTPAALALTATAALLLAIPLTAPSTAARLPAAPDVVPPAAVHGNATPATASTAAAAQAPREQVHGTRSRELADGSGAPAKVLRTVLSGAEGKAGHDEGVGAALRGKAEGETVTAAATVTVAVTAPMAGAALEVAAVPARYRAIVTAYLEAR